MLYAICAALAAALLGLDQWVKHYVTVNIPLGESQPLLPGLVELRTVHNYGAAWSSFSGMRWALVAVTAAIVLAVAVLLICRIVRHPLGVAAGFLILSGGAGNILDRVRLGYVVGLLHLDLREARQEREDPWRHGRSKRTLRTPAPGWTPGWRAGCRT